MEKQNLTFILPNPELREPQEFIDEAWLRTLYLGESVLEGFRLSRELAFGMLGSEPRPPGEGMDVLRSLWFRSVREGQVEDQVKRLAQRTQSTFFPFHQIFNHVADLVSRRRAPSSWPLAVAALIDGVIQGYRLQTAHFEDTVPRGTIPPDTTLMYLTWGLVNECETLSYDGNQTSDEMMALNNAHSRGRDITRRLNKREPRLYQDLARSLIQGRSPLVCGSDHCVLLAGYRLRPTTLLFYRIGAGTSYEVPLSKWMEENPPHESVTLMNVDHYKPELPYELPNLLAL